MKKILNIITNILLLSLILILIFNIFSIFYSKNSGSNNQISLFGYKLFIDASNSMEPTIKKGDLVITKEIEISKLKIGDIIVFYDKDNDIRITHRIANISDINGNITLITKGDKNKNYDAQIVTNDNLESKYLFKLSYVGNILLFFSTKIGFVTLILILATIIVIHYLISLLKK